MIKHLSRFALKYGLLPFAYYLCRLYFSLIRIRIVNEAPVLNRLKSGQKVIGAIWHQRIMLALGYAKKFGAYRPSVMISQSRDGDMIADVYSRFNFRPVRGSSSRGGKGALAVMIEDLSQNPFAVHVLDGPRGPKGVVKPGLVVMAQLSGVPIFPAYLSVNKAWVLNSWDRTLIPKPFSTITVRWGDPIVVPQDIDNDTFESTRKQIEQHMKENQNKDDAEKGWISPLL
jgi:lysophospholipid acyltransferase (LPLAT)-like uncharacterized protein